MSAKKDGEAPDAKAEDRFASKSNLQAGDKRLIQKALLAGNGCGDPLYREVFAQILAASLIDETHVLTDWLGLTPQSANALFAAYFPRFPLLSSLPPPSGQTPEEADLCALLLSFRASGKPEEEWLAMIVARRSQAKNHLWEDLGLENRDCLNALLEKAFPPLFASNVNDMRWKNFFHHLLCEKNGLAPDKPPMCDECPDAPACFETPGRRKK